jgi:alpha-beta hydrolase superfamily lysophospholipase
MKRVVFKNSRTQSLVGHLYRSKSRAIVIMSHALANDKSERGKFDAVAEKLHLLGYNVLTFDFSGCGESDDDTLTVGKQVDDLQSAIRFSKSLGYLNIGLFGHSLGCLVSLKCCTNDIRAMVLWSPITNKIHYTWDERLTQEQRRELKKKGYFTRKRKNAVRTTYLIDQQMLQEREQVDQTKLMSAVHCPTLLIHGTKDTNIPLNDSKKAIQLLSKNSQLAIVEGADHDFTTHVDIMVQLSTEWFLKYLQQLE